MAVAEKKILSKLQLTKEDILKDYRLACESREASILGRKEVFMGKAKFGIFGDGKELAQIAMAKAFQKGDWRAGYYRDQTFMMAIGALTLEEFFAQLYADTNPEHEPATAGRCMNSHFATHLVDEQGKWLNQTALYNSSADISPTAGQMPRLLGLAWASKLYRENPDLRPFKQFSNNGNEIAFGTIGNASTSEGMFFEVMNAAGVMQVPMLMSVWDDGYGISVSQEYHTIKQSISKALKGFQTDKDGKGFEIYEVKGWDYPALLETYRKAAEQCRKTHMPALVHVTEITQQLGHSTSGSHERYKSPERLEWERNYDCNRKFKEWILENGIATEEELAQIEKEALARVKQARNTAWSNYLKGVKTYTDSALQLLQQAAETSKLHAGELGDIVKEFKETINPIKRDAFRAVKRAIRVLRDEKELPARQALVAWVKEKSAQAHDEYSSHLYSETDESPLHVPEVKPIYSDDSPLVDGREIMQNYFDALFARDPRVIAFGEDVGRIGDVNQGMAGLQEKYGEIRITDTSIRECSILGQAIGVAMRGLRPIAEIQYLDYILYAVQIMSDDLATLRYRTKGRQKAPVIVRTRGHRLEGIWHSGSPMGMLLHSLRGMHVLVPRDMVRAAGFYNTMMQSDDPALIIECLNGYRLKERMPDNLADITVPLGVPEVLREGEDVTIVTYGSMCRIVMQAAEELAALGISCEVIDVQSLLPFDIHHHIVESVKKTNRLVVADEDVSGGATGFMLQKIVEEQGAYRWLDSQPLTIPAKDHRPAYGSDGDYFSKPNVEEIVDKVYAMMHEFNPAKFPALYE
ncbi:MAG: transketolase [Thermonema sp.]|uniref:alpha-ketoacid dehydrogenase subunit alpha/beta n=1 Tax=Thermonema sp. TaxID=2231181 RepID=UPI0021DDD750|nr:alpha-ketoacid dehydrogenase subunit alpha/beta [Thermonema sp.]GIV39112.1 MAG: transketolase [Thermonema sp.]